MKLFVNVTLVAQRGDPRDIAGARPERRPVQQARGRMRSAARQSGFRQHGCFYEPLSDGRAAGQGRACPGQHGDSQAVAPP